jgi:hypothetical protein
MKYNIKIIKTTKYKIKIKQIIDKNNTINTKITQ